MFPHPHIVLSGGDGKRRSTNALSFARLLPATDLFICAKHKFDASHSLIGVFQLRWKWS